MCNESPVTGSAAVSLRLLIAEARTQHDSTAWALALLKSVEALPEDIAFVVQSLNVAAKKFNEPLLLGDDLPRCSFCLKTSRYVLAMVTSPSANICNECVDIA